MAAGQLTAFFAFMVARIPDGRDYRLKIGKKSRFMVENIHSFVSCASDFTGKPRESIFSCCPFIFWAMESRVQR